MPAGSFMLIGSRARAACAYAGGGADCDGQLAAERQLAITQAMKHMRVPVYTSTAAVVDARERHDLRSVTHSLSMQSPKQEGQAGLSNSGMQCERCTTPQSAFCNAAMREDPKKRPTAPAPAAPANRACAATKPPELSGMK